MRIVVYIFCALFVCVISDGCSGRRANDARRKEFARKAEMIQMLMDKPQAVVVTRDSLFLEYLPDIAISLEQSLVYVVNSSCSFCIGKFIEFIYIMRDDTLPPVYLITNAEATDRLEYHLSEAKINISNIHVVGVDDAKYTSEVWVDNSSLVYVLTGGKVSNEFFYD